MKMMKTTPLVLAVMSLAGLVMASCEKKTTPPQAHESSEVHMTTVDFENAKAKFKASPGNRSKEAPMLAPMITPGMTEAQVRDVLGDPDQPKLGTPPNVWYYSVFYSQFISVTFEKGKVSKTEAVGIE